MKIQANHNIKGIYFFNKKILQFTNTNEVVSEEDIYMLFMGFVRLIRKSVEVEMEGKYLSTIKKLQKDLKKKVDRI